MNDLEPDITEKQKLGLNDQFESNAIKSQRENMEDLMTFAEGENKLQFGFNVMDQRHPPKENNFEAEQEEENTQRQRQQSEGENYTSPDVVKRNGLQQKEKNPYDQLEGQSHEEELTQSKLESVANESIEKEQNMKKLIDEAILKDTEHKKLLDDLDLQKADNQKSKANLLKQAKQIDLLTEELADLELQLAEKVQENDSIQRKYANVIEEVTTNDNNVKKLRNEATLRELEYKRVLDNLEKDRRKIDVQNKDIVDLTERLAFQVHDKELTQCKLESVSEELENLRNQTVAREEERKKLLETIERLGLEKAENQKNKEDLAKMIEKCKKQHQEIVDLRKTLNMHISLTTIIILSAVGIIGWNYFITNA